jgi:biopolymer transport protein ExbD
MPLKKRADSSVPQVNLVPMMDVLMTVLTFFIIISMTLTGEAVNVFLPETEGELTDIELEHSSPYLVVGLNADGEILFRNQVISSDQLVTELQSYFADNPAGIVKLKADRSLDYREVAELLQTLRDIGGGTVSLGVDAQ